MDSTTIGWPLMWKKFRGSREELIVWIVVRPGLLDGQRPMIIFRREGDGVAAFADAVAADAAACSNNRRPITCRTTSDTVSARHQDIGTSQFDWPLGWSKKCLNGGP